MADEKEVVRDLMRQMVLVGKDVKAQEPGMLDYAFDMQSGYIGSGTQDVGSYDFGGSCSYPIDIKTTPSVAADLPAAFV